MSPKGIVVNKYIETRGVVLLITENTPVEVGKLVRGKREGNKCRNTYLGTKCARCGKERWAVMVNGRVSNNLCTACSLLDTWANIRVKKYGTYEGNPIVGEIHTGTELGK